jgi:UDP-3-O-[3-hydroxymyristoyl] glucosamine N-acyltransferase
MEKDSPTWTLGELARLFGGELEGDPNYPISRPAPADSDDPQGIAFCESEKYLGIARAHRVGALILPKGLPSDGRPAIHVDHPRLAFFQLLMISGRPLPIEPGIHPTAIVHNSAQVGEGACIGPYAVVEKGAQVGSNVKVFPFCYVGEGCTIGEGTTLFPGVVLYQDVIIGARCIVHSGAVLGADGFGFMWDGSQQLKIPQVGRVQIGDDAEVGANTAVDRATAGATKVGRGTKLDNLVQVGHNVEIGEDSVIAGQAAIGGSARIGSRVSMGGQTAVSDHVVIGDDVMVGGSSGVAEDLAGPGRYFGRPAINAPDGLRAMSAIPRLPKILSRLRELEAKVKKLEEGQK